MYIINEQPILCIINLGILEIKDLEYQLTILLYDILYYYNDIVYNNILIIEN